MRGLKSPLHESIPAEVAPLLAPSFPEFEPGLRTRAVAPYPQQHTWA
jgi:hypothetical protein